MSDESATPSEVTSSVRAAVESVQRWHVEEQARHEAELGDAAREIEDLEAAISNLQHQLEALQRHRDDVARERDTLGIQQTERMYNAIFDALGVQLGRVSERADQALALERERLELITSALSQGDAARLVEEYRQFRAHVAPTLDSLPPSYRDVVRTHHEQVVSRIREAIDDHGGLEPVEVDADPIEAEIVFAVDAPEGTAELIMLVVPVLDQVRLGWRDRDEDAQTWLAARAVQAVFEVCRELGLPHAQAMFGGHRGLLAVEVELSGGAPDEIRDALQERLTRILDAAPELQDVRLAVRPCHALVDHLLPPEEDETVEVTDAR